MDRANHKSSVSPQRRSGADLYLRQYETIQYSQLTLLYNSLCNTLPHRLIQTHPNSSTAHLSTAHSSTAHSSTLIRAVETKLKGDKPQKGNVVSEHSPFKYFIGGIDFSITSQDLRNYFFSMGVIVVTTQVIRKNGNSR